MSKYGVIIADPPWQYSNRQNGAAESHYATLTIDDLCGLPVASWASANSVLLLWATWPQLADAMRLMAAWDFEYVTGFPWVKLQHNPESTLFGEITYQPAFGTGFWVRGCSEMVLIGKHGKPRPPDQDWLGLLSKRFAHSRKPDNLYEYAESMPGPYLELFARRVRDGWTQLGNGIDGRDIRDALTVPVLEKV